MTLSEKAEEFVHNLLKDKLSASYTYHNFDHTKRVVSAAAKLAENENLTPAEAQALELACWFHDTGYIYGPDRHEHNSTLVLNGFCEANQVPEDVTAIAGSLIRVTEMCHEPRTIAEKIIRDADCSHFGSEKYEKISDYLRLEWATTQNRTYTDAEWAQGNLDMLAKWHRFYTDYARQNWQPQKEKNISAIKQKLKQMEPETDSGKKKKKKRKNPKKA